MSSKSVIPIAAEPIAVSTIQRQKVLRLGVSGLPCLISAASTSAGSRGPKRPKTRAVFIKSEIAALGPMDLVM